MSKSLIIYYSHFFNDKDQWHCVAFPTGSEQSESASVQVMSVPASLVPYSLSLVARVSSPHPVTKVESNCSLEPLQYLNAEHTQASVSSFSALWGVSHLFSMAPLEFMISLLNCRSSWLQTTCLTEMLSCSFTTRKHTSPLLWWNPPKPLLRLVSLWRTSVEGLQVGATRLVLAILKMFWRIQSIEDWGLSSETKKLNILKTIYTSSGGLYNPLH